MNNSTRRDFLRASTAAAVICLPPSAPALTEPIVRQGARLRLSLAAYSFRTFFSTMRSKPSKLSEEKQIDMRDFIDLCAAYGCGAGELTSYFFDPDITDAELAAVRAHAHLQGVEISGTAVGNNFSHPANSSEHAQQMDYVKRWIDRAVVLGAPHIRVFAGKHPKGIAPEAAEKNAAAALEEAGAYAGERGIFLGIENHDSIGDADRLLRIVKAVKSPWVGVNLDTGNFRTDDPYDDILRSAPYAVNVQVKVELRVKGKKEPADLERIARLLREANYCGYVVLEYEAAEDPYKAVPVLLDRMQKFCEH